MTALEYGSSLERVAGWNPAVVTICSGGEIGYHESLRNFGSGFEFRLEYLLICSYLNNWFSCLDSQSKGTSSNLVRSTSAVVKFYCKHFGRFSSFKDSVDAELLQLWYTLFILVKAYVGSSPTRATKSYGYIIELRNKYYIVK